MPDIPKPPFVSGKENGRGSIENIPLPRERGRRHTVNLGEESNPLARVRRMTLISHFTNSAPGANVLILALTGLAGGLVADDRPRIVPVIFPSGHVQNANQIIHVRIFPSLLAPAGC